MTDYYLKFKDEAEASALLENYEGSVDVIGEIEGQEGWHVNVRGPESEDLAKFSVEVRSPLRVWM